MDYLTGPNVQVILGLKEGKGFDNVTKPMCIVATLNGLSATTDLFEPSSCPQFETDLVWEETKPTLRKMRSGQEPLKIECFECKQNNVREKIGFLLLSLRTAQVVHERNITSKSIKINWHKLSGLRSDVRHDKPELYISLTIEEGNFSSCNNSPDALPPKLTLPLPEVPVPYLIPEEHLIQLGPIVSCKETFRLSIITSNIENFNNLVPEIPTSNRGKRVFTLVYNLLENQVESKPITVEDLSLDEKIVFQIRSSLSVFKNYLHSKPYIHVTLKHDEHEIVVGQAQIDIRPLIPVDNADDFLSAFTSGICVLNHHCILKPPDCRANGMSPLVNVQVQLQYFGLNTLNDLRPGPKDDSKDAKVVTMQKATNSVYHYYTLDLTVDNVKLNSHIENIECRYYHLHGEITRLTRSTDDGEKHQRTCKLYFIATESNIYHLLSSYPSKILIFDGDESHENVPVGQCVFNLGQFFKQKMLKHECKMALLDKISNTTVGSIGLTVRLTNHGHYHDGEHREEENFDSNVSYKIVEELETWKERQQELFRADLKAREERHLNRLSAEWQKRKEALESKLLCSMEQCRVLANNLNSTTLDLRQRRLQSLEKEANLIKTNEDLKWTFERKFAEISEASQKMQQDYASKLSLLEEQKNQLKTQVDSLKSENTELAVALAKQSEEFAAYKQKSSQEINELEIKLSTSQKGKAFFKEQWGKAVREIYKIKSNREDLKTIDLQDMLHADSAALSNDKIVLGQLQKQIDVIRPKSERHWMPPDGEQQVEKLQKLMEEREALLKTKSYDNEDPIIVKLNAEIQSLLVNS